MHIIIIGSGIAGMAAAIRLAVHGHQVEVFESNSIPGGKNHQILQNGYRFDAGPSLLTLPNLVDDLFFVAGKDRSTYLKYYKSPVTCKYFYEDGSIITAYNDTDKLKAELMQNGFTFNNLDQYLLHNKRIFNAAFPIFLNKSIHKKKTFLSKQFLKSITGIDFGSMFQTMHHINSKYFSDLRLVQLFDRYATYNGSNPYRTPGIFTMISHLENSLGTYTIEGGMANLSSALYKLACDCGVTFHFDQSVHQIIFQYGQPRLSVKGVIAGGEFYQSDLVISNADVNYTYEYLLKGIRSPKTILNLPRSNSAIIFYWGVKGNFPKLDLHNILFSYNYYREFDTLFNKYEVTDDPTVYLYISSKINQVDAPPGHENWYVSVNVPWNIGQDWDAIVIKTKRNILQKIKWMLKIDIEPLIESEKIYDPNTIERFTSAWQGSIYGNSTPSIFSPFFRHANFSSNIKGLYFCGGTVHPGGGIPLCILSGKIVAELISKDFSKQS